MTRILLISLLILFFTLPSKTQAQDIPLFSQKLTNSFLYNPAVAGHTVGSATYSYRQTYSKINNAPRSNLLSLHAPIKNHKIGIGFNYFQEDVNFLRNGYASAALAYHIIFNKVNTLSFGLSGEYNFMRLAGTSNSNTEDIEYQKLANGDFNDFDFSFGTLYQTKYLKIGLAANRLATAWIKDDNKKVLSSYYSGFVQGLIPLRRANDLLEPYFSYRSMSATNSVYDIGLYYTYDNKITAGIAYRSGSMASATLGVRVGPKVFIGYSQEIFLNGIRQQTGGNHEFTVRLDFNEYHYKNRFIADYKASLAYRRKTLTKMPPRVGASTSEKFHKQQKKLKGHSPNTRYHVVKRPKRHKQHGITPPSQMMKRRR